MDGIPEIWSHRDGLLSKVRAFIDINVLSDRSAISQVSLLGSLHCESREGIKSALDCLSLAFRACQEMGIHRKGLSEEDGNAQLGLASDTSMITDSTASQGGGYAPTLLSSFG